MIIHGPNNEIKAWEKPISYEIKPHEKPKIYVPHIFLLIKPNLKPRSYPSNFIYFSIFSSKRSVSSHNVESNKMRQGTETKSHHSDWATSESTTTPPPFSAGIRFLLLSGSPISLFSLANGGSLLEVRRSQAAAADSFSLRKTTSFWLR